MFNRVMRLVMVVTLFVSCSLFMFTAPDARAQEKIGVLMITGGISEDYGAEWRVGFYDHLFPVWPPGFLAGGPKEGGSCYTLLHYANVEEAFICGVEEGTLIDMFCDEYTGPYEVHSLEDHFHPNLGGDGTFYTDCYPSMLPAVVFNGHTTIDPVTQEEITGPHIHDPAGSGIGIADFIERAAFSFMEVLYHLPNNQNPSHRQDLKWFYGNDTPGHLSYPPDSPELTNVKDELIARGLPGVTFAFRHGSEAFMKNVDAYGNPYFHPESTETAIEELIHDEQVDRIVVLNAAPDDSNLTSTGPCWLNENGEGVSVVIGKTYRECLEDFEDGLGPNQQNLDLYYEEKPWVELMKIAYPETVHLVHEVDPTMEVSFAPSFNAIEGFELAVLDMVNYTISKYSIPDTASVRVIVGAHGISSAWRGVLECDSYFRTVPDVKSRLKTRIEGAISPTRTGTFEVVGGEGEQAETEFDPVSAEKPFGDVWSTAERIDEAMNGTYVNELGQVVDNGTDNFDYIIVVPISWQSDSTDTLEHGRAEVLGNNILSSIGGVPAYERDHDDEDGTHFDQADYDSEYFTVKSLDATGWPSVPGCLEDPNCESSNPPVNYGSATDPTTVIITSTILSIGNSPARTNLTDAAVDSIVAAINNPNAGGYPDRKCEVDCVGNFDCDADCDGSDAATFKLDFGRSLYSNPCTSVSTCNGDFNCDGDSDGSDAALFKKDFGRSGFNNPCSFCLEEPWCAYP